MGCLTASFGAILPRLAVLVMWIARPGLFETAFGSTLIPLLGIAILPFTTLMYVITWSPTWPSGLDFLWLIIAIGIDVFNMGSTAYTSRSATGWSGPEGGVPR